MTGTEEVCVLSGQMQFLQIFTSEQLVDSLNAECIDVERERASVNQLSDIFATEKKMCAGTQTFRRENLQLDSSGKDY